MTTTTPKSTIIDIATGEVTKVVLSNEELAQREAEAAAEIAAIEAKLAARQSALAKLAELGLTADEIAAL